jgi:hypothetical protein
MKEEEKVLRKELRDTSASALWINIKLLWLCIAVLLCLNYWN